MGEFYAIYCSDDPLCPLPLDAVGYVSKLWRKKDLKVSEFFYSSTTLTLSPQYHPFSCSTPSPPSQLTFHLHHPHRMKLTPYHPHTHTPAPLTITHQHNPHNSFSTTSPSQTHSPPPSHSHTSTTLTNSLSTTLTHTSCARKLLRCPQCRVVSQWCEW